ncbi:Site-specific recombinase XerD [Pseudoxanthomonas indica]|uniref:Site-specific recombinase XerD n=1 Tax=Pseudoxanthomonas indica TaxID=428993 RepID=A0A1T5JF89_9GAMM|nr:integrase [Pseudoxanthomonas indica]SKC50079.1 Site-specific recombinase XerD [Pseudoxanthomonas indica]
MPLGTDLSLADARTRAAELSRRYQDGERDLRGALDRQEREQERLRVATEQAALEEQARSRATLGALLEAYVADLRRGGKVSARAVERSLERNLKEAMPELWAKRAADATDDDLLAVVARLADGDKLREAAKVRSYLRAAFAAALKARHNARALPALRELGIRHNPAVDLVPVDGAADAGERALSVGELRAYWRRIAGLEGPEGAVLRFHLLTGAQRLAQLARLVKQDYDSDSRTVRLRDSKGRRRVPRQHVVPLIPAAVEALQEMGGGKAGPHLFTLTAGLAPADYSSLRHRLMPVMAAMQEAGELESGPFTLGDIRRTVETRLAAAGLSLEVRGQLQSHGLGGVQSKHYDRHNYLNEKREALETLYKITTGESASITAIRKKRVAK